MCRNCAYTVKRIPQHAKWMGWILVWASPPRSVERAACRDKWRLWRLCVDGGRQARQPAARDAKSRTLTIAHECYCYELPREDFPAASWRGNFCLRSKALFHTNRHDCHISTLAEYDSASEQVVYRNGTRWAEAGAIIRRATFKPRAISSAIGKRTDSFHHHSWRYGICWRRLLFGNKVGC